VWDDPEEDGSEVLEVMQRIGDSLQEIGKEIMIRIRKVDRLCGLVVRVIGYRSGGPGSISCTTRKKSSGSGTGFTQPREYN
jgi:hypothetical protein